MIGRVTQGLFVAVLGCTMAMGLAGCGERSQVVDYKQGKYQGKPDKPAYDSAPWNGNKRDWELALAQRNQSQNEYKRIR